MMMIDWLIDIFLRCLAQCKSQCRVLGAHPDPKSRSLTLYRLEFSGYRKGPNKLKKDVVLTAVKDGTLWLLKNCQWNYWKTWHAVFSKPAASTPEPWKNS